MCELPYDLFLREYEILCRYPEFKFEPYDTVRNISDPENNQLWNDLKDYIIREKIFFDDKTIDCIMNKMKERYHQKNSYVYYTSLETANKIFAKQELWLRSTTLMNDDHELVFGKDAVDRILSQEDVKSIIGEYCKLFKSDGYNEFFQRYQSLYQSLQYRTYIICFSNEEMNGNGKLSMWRAYAPRGVAIFFNQDCLTGISAFLDRNLQGVYNNRYTFSHLLPVLYTEDSAKSFQWLFERTLSRVVKNQDRYKMASDLIPQLYLDQLYDMIFYSMFLFKTKYYEEEKEYRLFLSSLDEINQLKFLQRQEVNCAGTDQYVYKLSLQEIFLSNSKSNPWDALVDKIIIWGKLNNISSVSNNLLLDHIVSLGISLDKVQFADIPFREPR